MAGQSVLKRLSWSFCGTSFLIFCSVRSLIAEEDLFADVLQTNFRGVIKSLSNIYDDDLGIISKFCF